ncbi:MAG: hypothetical protein PVH29_10555 [Candidatus Zixiibacteriota bacterium]|jgi:hypothetical protein
MGRIFVTVFLTVFSATAAFPYLGEVVGSFDSPDAGITGLAISSEHLFALRAYIPDTPVYRCNPITGSVVGSFGLPWRTDYLMGLAYSGDGYLWTSDVENRYVCKIDVDSGNFCGSWSTHYMAYGLAPRCTGDGGVGTSRILGTDEYDTVFVHEKAGGSISASFSIAHPNYSDCAYDWRNEVIWQVSGDSPYHICGYRLNGAILASFPNPNPYRFGTYSLAYRGEYLWFYAGVYPDYDIYRIHCPARLSVEPASLGKVKALYR